MKGKLPIIITTILSLIIVVQIFYIYQQNLNYSTLKNEYTSLSSQYDQLSSNYTALNQRYNQLYSEKNLLKNNYTDLSTLFNSLQGDFRFLNKSYIELNRNYSSLEANIRYLTNALERKYEEDYAYIRYLTLPMPKGLDEHHFFIRKQELLDTSKFRDKGDAGWLLFYVTQVLHDLGDYSYDYCITLRKYGEDCKYLTANFASDFLGYVNKSYPNVYPNISRLQQVYNWVNVLVSYMDGITRFPIETLIFRCGDCDDQAMALSFLLESCGYETALCVIHDKNLTEYGPEGLYHAFCVVRKNNFEYSGTLIQLNKYPEYGNNWIVLDPVFGHLFGRDPEWIDNYRMENGTVYIPQAVWGSLLVDYNELVNRAKEIEITLNA